MEFFVGDEVLAPYAKIIDPSTGSTVVTAGLAKADTIGEDNVYKTTLTGLTAGWLLLMIGVDTSNVDDDAFGKLHYVRARPRLTLQTAVAERVPASVAAALLQSLALPGSQNPEAFAPATVTLV